MKVTIVGDQITVEKGPNDKDNGVRLYTRLEEDGHNPKPVGYLTVGTYVASHGAEFKGGKLAIDKICKAREKLRTMLKRNTGEEQAIDLDIIAGLERVSDRLHFSKLRIEALEVQLKGASEAHENDLKIHTRNYNHSQAQLTAAQEKAEHYKEALAQRKEEWEERQRELVAQIRQLEARLAESKGLLHRYQDIQAEIRLVERGADISYPVPF